MNKHSELEIFKLCDSSVKENYQEQNIIKQTCKELNLTYKQLGEAIGYGEEAISKASRTSNISTAMNKTLELYLKNLELKNRLKTLDTLSNIIKELSKDENDCKKSKNKNIELER